MSRINYKAKLDERLDELRRLYNNDCRITEAGHIGWSYEGRLAGTFCLYRVINNSGGTRVVRRAGSKAELLDYIEGMIDGTRAARMADENPTRDAFMN